VSEAGSGAFVDHSGSGNIHYFDMAFREEFGFGGALHEWTHVLGLNHVVDDSSPDWWSVVYDCPFGPPCGADNPYYPDNWVEYPSNDDIVGLSTFYNNQPADCTPYLSLSNKLFLPFIPASGYPDPSNAATGYWAVLQWNGAGQLTLLEYGAARTYRYDCSTYFNGSGTITSTGYREDTDQTLSFTMTNNDPTGANKSYWTISAN
jgi:hypothetical protein